MNREKYLATRRDLLSAAQAALDAGKMEELAAKKKEVEELDARYETAAKEAVNLDALKGAAVGASPFQGLIRETTEPEGETKTPKATGGQPESYASAWHKRLNGEELSGKEKEAFVSVNGFKALTVEDQPLVVPTQVSTQIINYAVQSYPMFGDAYRSDIRGNVTLIVGGESSEAAFYLESDQAADGTETFKTISLSGCELARTVPISWKMEKMSMEALSPYLASRQGEMMGRALGIAVAHGKGKPTATEHKPEPLGVITALEKEPSAPQILTYAEGALKYSDLLSAMSNIGAAFTGGTTFYANSKTVWNVIANILDTNKRPLFVADVINGGVGHILGQMVKPDDSLRDGEILLGNLARGYQFNFNAPTTMQMFNNHKTRSYDYVGYAIVDGVPLNNKAFALLKVGVGG